LLDGEKRRMLLKTLELRYAYPGNHKEILQGVTVNFRAGEITALTGDNGCGKTTLLKLLAGILKPSAGRILIDGKDTAAMSLAEIGRQVACVFQNPAQQVFCTTVEEEVAFGLKNMGLDREEIETRISSYLEYFELTEYRKTFPQSLSQGEKQRLMLAAVLAMHPRFLILDEPTTGLDIYRRKLLGDYLLRIREDGYGVIIISHQFKFIDTYADRVLHLEEGQISEEQRRACHERA
jgi:energy-coupling factor transport system ATP-binding protein